MHARTAEADPCGVRGAPQELLARNGSNPLPPDYNGWLAYTAYNNRCVSCFGEARPRVSVPRACMLPLLRPRSQGFDQFLGKFTIPHNPPQMPHILYLFIGLQNKDWVPKVDPLPESQGFDIIQARARAAAAAAGTPGRQRRIDCGGSAARPAVPGPTRALAERQELRSVAASCARAARARGR